MNAEELSKEQSILHQMRKTLDSIVKDATPRGGQPHPLTNSTIEEIKFCFALISEREKDLAEKLGFGRNTDGEQPGSSTVSFVKLPRYKS